MSEVSPFRIPPPTSICANFSCFEKAKFISVHLQILFPSVKPLSVHGIFYNIIKVSDFWNFIFIYTLYISTKNLKKKCSLRLITDILLLNRPKFLFIDEMSVIKWNENNSLNNSWTLSWNKIYYLDFLVRILILLIT